jgi:hypothetical protein
VEDRTPAGALLVGHCDSVNNLARIVTDI